MLKLGYFEHWTRPPFKFVEWAKEQGVEFKKIDFTKKGYLDGFDVVLIEQHGFNDYIENDEDYLHDWVKKGGILLMMAQDYKRFAPFFFPQELGYNQVIHRHVETVTCPPYLDEDKSPWKIYMMPWIEEPGRKLFSEPEVITPDEMIHWYVKLQNGEEVCSAATCCLLPDKQMEVLGSYMDPAVKDGALIAKCNYGKGMFFVNQLLFPEIYTEKSERCLAFWKKYLKNLLAYFNRFRNQESEEMPPKVKELPIKRNYKMATHVHSLDWYGCDSAPGTINAMMRLKKCDICSITIKYTAPYGGKLDIDKYTDDKVLMLQGQEFHPFNWNDKYDSLSHNTYHMLTIGVDNDGFTTKFTRSLFNDDEVNDYLKEAVKFVHDHNGVICSAHAYGYYFDREVGYDAMDEESMTTLVGTNVERYWLEGGKCALMSTIDLFGFRRFINNPAFSFIYLDGKTPNRDNICEAIRKRHTIASTFFEEADITLGDYLPGDEVTLDELKTLPLNIKASIERGNIKELRVYSGDKKIFTKALDEKTIDISLSLKDYDLSKFVRVELTGENKYYVCNSTPFFIK